MCTKSRTNGPVVVVRFICNASTGEELQQAEQLGRWLPGINCASFAIRVEARRDAVGELASVEDGEAFVAAQQLASRLGRDEWEALY